jgi:diguanylate cyclase (GGDEF)-like protein
MPSIPTVVLAILTVALALLVLYQNERYLKTRELADRDALTGLLNYRAMYEQIERELSRARRSGSTTVFSVVVIDLDSFKGFNDTFGHAVGDEALRRVAEVLKRLGRDSDVFGRHGGDEFMGLLWNCDRVGARALFGRVVDSLAEQWNAHGNKAMPPIRLTFGVAEYPEDGHTANELVRAADRELYRGKAQTSGGERATEERDVVKGHMPPLCARGYTLPEECFWYPNARA